MDLKQAMGVITQALEKANQGGAFSLTKETNVILNALNVVSNFVEDELKKEDGGSQTKELKKTK